MCLRCHSGVFYGQTAPEQQQTGLKEAVEGVVHLLPEYSEHATMLAIEMFMTACAL